MEEALRLPVAPGWFVPGGSNPHAQEAGRTA